MRARDLLWVDCSGGLVAGAVVLILSEWLAGLYAMPRALVVAVALANLGYGAFSFGLARRVRRPTSLIAALGAANVAWGVLCAVGVAVLWKSASWFGLVHLAAEGVFVGGLGWLEWRRRAQLA